LRQRVREIRAAAAFSKRSVETALECISVIGPAQKSPPVSGRAADASAWSADAERMLKERAFFPNRFRDLLAHARALRQ
jgi:hypothetical protein